MRTLFELEKEYRHTFMQARSLRRTPRSLFWTSVRGVALQKKPMYGTRPCRLVQAITRNTCLDPHLGSGNCLTHQAHIAPSEQHRPAEFESRIVPDFLLPFITTLIGVRAFDLVSSLVWWETLANIGTFFVKNTPEPVLDIGPGRGSAK